MTNKKSYFQGTEEPKKGKGPQYKPEPKPLLEPRFTEPFYKNYDYVDVPGVHGPGVSQHTDPEAFKKNRKKLLDKYKAKPRYKDEYGNISYTKQSANIKYILTKLATDYKADQLKNPLNFSQSEEDYSVNKDLRNLENNDTISNNTTGFGSNIPNGGMYDKIVPLNDPDDKDPTKLNFGRDIVDPNNNSDLDEDDIPPLNSAETSLLGLNRDLPPTSDLEANNFKDPEFRTNTFDIGNTSLDEAMSLLPST